MTNLLDEIQNKSTYQVLIRGVLSAWIRINKNNSNFTCQPKEILDNLEIKNALDILSKEKLVVLHEYFSNMAVFEIQQEINNLNAKVKDDDYLINGISDDCLSEEEKKALGSVNTPNWLADYITKKAIHYWKKQHKEDLGTVGDLSCGPGIFLNKLQKYCTSSSTIIGVDKNEEYSCLAKLSMAGKGTKVVIECLDTLTDLKQEEQIDIFSMLSEFSEIKNQNFDLLVGNPPYIRSQSINKNYSDQLRNLYPEVTEGNFDLTVPFISHTIDSLTQGGVGALIVSSKFMVSSYGKRICEKLLRDIQLLEIVDFGDGQLFPKKTTYTCIIIFSKNSLNMEEKKMNQIKITKFSSGLKWKNDASNLKDARESFVYQDQLNIHPWNLNTGLHDEIFQLMQNPKLPSTLEFFPKIIQGVRTGANNVFIINKKEAESTDTELLIPFIDGTNIRKCEIIPSTRFLIWPYERIGDSISILNEEVLKKNYSKTWIYLNNNKLFLESRNLDDKTPWYGYSRSQNLGLSTLPKIFVREMMPSAQFSVDIEGHYSFSSGYAFINEEMDKNELKMWAAVLSTPTLEFQLRLIGTQLHSGWFRILKKNLARLRLPLFNKEMKEKATTISLLLHEDPHNNKLWAQLDEIVANSFSLNTEMKEEIKNYLIKTHKVSMPNLELTQLNKELILETEKPRPSSLVEYKTAYPDISIDDRSKYIPVELAQYNNLHVQREDLKQLVTFKKNKGNKIIHRWYPYTQGYSAELVEILLNELNFKKDSKVYDPFLGSGTTVLTCKLLGIDSFGAEISPLMSWVAKVKVTNYDINNIKNLVSLITDAKISPVIDTDLVFNDYMQKAYAPEILAQIIGWRNWILNLSVNQEEKDFLLLALVSILEEISLIRKHGSHYRYLNKTENIGILKLNISTIDSSTDIKHNLLKKIEQMITDVEATNYRETSILSEVYNINSREEIPNHKADIVITSPPYLNRNNYFTQQKAELSLLNLISSKEHYKTLVQNSFKSHVEFKFDPNINSEIPEINKLISKIKLSENNNPKIPHMISGYFDDLKQTLINIKRILNPGAKLAFVVGNTRWGGVVVPVDHFLALIAEREGYKVDKILVARYKGNSPQQMKKFGRIPVRESIVILEWNPKN